MVGRDKPAPGWEFRAARRIMVFVEERQRQCWPLQNGGLDIIATMIRYERDQPGPSTHVHRRYTRHAEASLEGCDPQTCQNKEHWFYEVL